jgi:hypothetical protein
MEIRERERERERGSPRIGAKVEIRMRKLLSQIRILRTRAKEFLALDPMAAQVALMAAQVALTEARRSATIENPKQALSFFVDCFKPLSFSPVYKSHQALELLNRVSQFLEFRDATLPLSVALPVALYADSMLSDFRSEPYSGDLGFHFAITSSLGQKARLVFNLIRALKPKACLELGTSYGISAYLIASCQKLCALPAHVVTIEKYSPYKEISQAFLQKHFPEAVKTLHADKQDAIAQLVAASEQFDFVFTTLRIPEIIMFEISRKYYHSCQPEQLSL